ncbi:MAG: FAD-dependent oxidoreductase [Myxococcota bacterium]
MARKKSEEAAEGFELEADVVVVGSGIAGMAAAATAASRGRSVIVFEKGREIGGTSVLSSGEYWVPNNRWLRADGIEDPRDDCLRYMARLSYPSLYDPESETLGLPHNEYELLEAYYDRGTEAVDHLHDVGAIKSRYSPDFDKPMGKPEYNAHLPENRVPFGRHLLSEGGIHTSGQGAFLIGAVREYLEKTDTKVLHSHAVTGLVRDAQGAVIGVEVTDPSGRKLRARARGGVVFASGGFAHDPVLTHRYLRGRLYGSTAVATNTGDFLRLAQNAGASVANLEMAWWGQTPLELALEKGGQLAGMSYFPWGDSMIMVNVAGHRVVNEKAPYHERAQAHFYFDPTAKRYTNQVLIQIYDRYVAETPEPEGWHKVRAPIPPVGEFPDYLIIGETLEELAQEIGKRLETLRTHTGALELAPDFRANLEKTIARFDGFAREGKDLDFGRGETPHELNYSPPIRNGLKNQTMAPFESTGPYCAILLVPACFDTCGGPRIDREARVIDADDRPIPGLYAAGNCVASPAGQAYWSGGTTIGSALIFGYIAGLGAAQASEADSRPRASRA